MPTHLLAKMKIAKLISRLSLLVFLKLKPCIEAVEKCILYHLNACRDFISTNLGLNQVLF